MGGTFGYPCRFRGYAVTRTVIAKLGLRGRANYPGRTRVATRKVANTHAPVTQLTQSFIE